MKYNDVKLDGRSFNTNHVVKFATVGEWLKYAEANPHWYEGEADRDAKLTEVYTLAQAEAAEEIAEEEVKTKKRAPRKAAAADAETAQEDISVE